MSSFKVDNEGYVIDASGVRLERDGVPIKVDALNQSRVDDIVKDRLARERAKFESEESDLKDRIAALQTSANRTPELERELSKARDQLAANQLKMSEANANALKEVATQLQDAQSRAEQFEAKYNGLTQHVERNNLTNLILANEGAAAFFNPQRDLVPFLLTRHKREPKLNAEGQKVEGKYVDLFEVEVKGEDGETSTKALPLDKAVKTLIEREDFQHYLRASNRGGSGGSGNGGQVPPLDLRKMRRSEMSSVQKSEFIDKYGSEEYKRLAP